jgi:hypothetical protein
VVFKEVSHVQIGVNTASGLKSSGIVTMYRGEVVLSLSVSSMTEQSYLYCLATVDPERLRALYAKPAQPNDGPICELANLHFPTAGSATFHFDTRRGAGTGNDMDEGEDEVCGFAGVFRRRRTTPGAFAHAPEETFAKAERKRLLHAQHVVRSNLLRSPRGKREIKQPDVLTVSRGCVPPLSSPPPHRPHTMPLAYARTLATCSTGK